MWISCHWKLCHIWKADRNPKGTYNAVTQSDSEHLNTAICEVFLKISFFFFRSIFGQTAWTEEEQIQVTPQWLHGAPPATATFRAAPRNPRGLVPAPSISAVVLISHQQNRNCTRGPCLSFLLLYPSRRKIRCRIQINFQSVSFLFSNTPQLV